MLDRLRLKWRRRREARKRHKELWKRHHKHGFAIAAARDGRAMRKLRKLIAKAIHELPPLERVRVHSTAAGRPHWGGAADAMGQFVTPFMRHRGLAPGSKKRTPAHNAAIGGSPTSDHLTTHTTTFATDFPTFTGEDDARALAHALGWEDWVANSFAKFVIHVDAHSFEVQILWGAAIDHGDHVHVGIELIG